MIISSGNSATRITITNVILLSASAKVRRIHTTGNIARVQAFGERLESIGDEKRNAGSDMRIPPYAELSVSEVIGSTSPKPAMTKVWSVHRNGTILVDVTPKAGSNPFGNGSEFWHKKTARRIKRTSGSSGSLPNWKVGVVLDQPAHGVKHFTPTEATLK